MTAMPLCTHTFQSKTRREHLQRSTHDSTFIGSTIDPTQINHHCTVALLRDSSSGQIFLAVNVQFIRLTAVYVTHDL